MEDKLNKKIEKLLEKADKKFKVAQNLFKDGSFDDSISRAYYAMYQVATALLLTKDIVCKTHSGLLQMFSLHFIKTGIMDKRYFDMLAAAKDLRENGDYEAFFVARSEDAEETLENAKEFIEEAKRILGR
jgi:hypothetical protein